MENRIPGDIGNVGMPQHRHTQQRPRPADPSHDSRATRASGSDPARPFGGSTLTPLMSHVCELDLLLVITNAVTTERGRHAVNEALADRGRVVTWLGPKDDDVLQEALTSLLGR